MPLIALGVITAAGSLGGAAIASAGGNKAANTQANAALAAAQLQHGDALDALNFNKGQYANSQKEFAPFLNTAYGAEANLAYQLGILPHKGASSTNGAVPGYTAGSATASVPVDPLAAYQGRSFGDLINSGDPNVSSNAQTTSMWQQTGIPFHNVSTSDGRQVAVRDTSGGNVPSPESAGINIPANLSDLVNPDLGAEGSLTKDWTENFNAPNDVTEQNDPGYKFRLQQGQDAIERSAASRGGLLSTGTAKALDDYSQNSASAEYGNVYNRAFNEYATRYNQFQNNIASRYNKLSAIAGGGQTAAQQLGLLGENAAGTNANIALTSGQQIGNDLTNAGAARASGYQNSGNVYGNAISSLPGNLTSLYMLSKLMKPTSAATGPSQG